MRINITDPDGNIFETVSISENEVVQDIEQANTYLDSALCRDFRNAINSSPIFVYDPKYLSKYNLCCAVMDRLDTCIEKLNQYDDYPDTEEDFLIFMMFACMVKDAVRELLEGLEISMPQDEKKYFGEIYRKSPVYNSEAEDPTDDKFFEYLRSLMFAHPFETSRAKFLKKGETQYSPWVIVNRFLPPLLGEEYTVGVRVYTNQSERILDIHFSFQLLKDYIRSKYEQLALATDWAKQQVLEAKKEWQNIKINREQSPENILGEIEKILISRYSDTSYSIKELLQYLSCELSDESNRSSVRKFKNSIIEKLPVLCDATDAVDDERIQDICNEILRNPQEMHQMAYYQMEKIFCYLGECQLESTPNETERWGLTQAQYFWEEFAKKWVNIDIKNMSFQEIKLLVRTACYLERQEQEVKQ